MLEKRLAYNFELNNHFKNAISFNNLQNICNIVYCCTNLSLTPIIDTKGLIIMVNVTPFEHKTKINRCTPKPFINYFNIKL